MSSATRGKVDSSRSSARAYIAGWRDGVRATHTNRIARVARRLFRQDREDLARVARQRGPDGLLARLQRLIRDIFLPRWQDALADVLEPVMEDAAAPQEDVLGVGFDTGNEFMRTYFENYTLELATEITETTRGRVEDELKRAIAEGIGAREAATRLEEVLSLETDASWTKARAQAIARTELVRAANAANYLSAAESGLVTHKTHHHAGDARVREDHHFTETVPIKQPYRNGELFSGQLSVNCRCFDEFDLDPSLFE